MIVPQAIFSTRSIQPLLAIWAQLEKDVSIAIPHPRDFDLRGEFAAVANAWRALAQDNSDAAEQMHPKKAARQSHEDACTRRVRETYNNYLTIYNTEHRTNAIALGGLSLAAPETIVARPAKMTVHHDPIDYALAVASYYRQYWTSALAFICYAREALNLQRSEKILAGVTSTIAERYVTPLQKQAQHNWMALLIIGGRPEQLQLAREQLALNYINGVYDTTMYLNPLEPYRHSSHPMAKTLTNAFALAIAHPRSNPDPSPQAAVIDLGL